jgi:hypothetical protein
MDSMQFNDERGVLSHLKGIGESGLNLGSADRPNLFGVRVGHKHGTLRRYSEWEFFPNTVTEVFRTDILDTRLRTGIASPLVYFIPITGPIGSITFVAGDTMASHAGWAEDEDYDEADRQAWTPGAASAQSITSASSATITITTGTTISGLALTDTITKGGTTGLLICGGVLLVDKILSAAETLDMAYTINA